MPSLICWLSSSGDKDTDDGRAITLLSHLKSLEQASSFQDQNPTQAKSIGLSDQELTRGKRDGHQNCMAVPTSSSVLR